MSEMVMRGVEVLGQFDLDSAQGSDYEKNLEVAARAFIAAMREPTGAMVDTAWAYALAEDARGVWEAMIDEALK